MSERKEKTRALFKKGQKCLIPKFYFDAESGEEVLMFSQGQVCLFILYRLLIISCFGECVSTSGGIPSL